MYKLSRTLMAAVGSLLISGSSGALPLLEPNQSSIPDKAFVKQLYLSLQKQLTHCPKSQHLLSETSWDEWFKSYSHVEYRFEYDDGHVYVELLHQVSKNARLGASTKVEIRWYPKNTYPNEDAFWDADNEGVSVHYLVQPAAGEPLVTSTSTSERRAKFDNLKSVLDSAMATVCQH